MKTPVKIIVSGTLLYTDETQKNGANEKNCKLGPIKGD
jgi:hypothetical protein